MNKRIAVAAIPVPPSPVLEQAVGYENNKGARYLALWWEPGGDEAMVSDGYVTFTGHWPGYLAYIHHPSVYPYLVTYNLGSSDDLAEYRLVIDLQERQAFIARARRQSICWPSQWETEAEAIGKMFDFHRGFGMIWLRIFEQVLQFTRGLDELERRMEADRSR